jgi:hypothetical protein
MTGQLSGLTEFLSGLRQLLPRGTSGRETVMAVRAALRESEKVGLAPSREDAAELARLLEIADHADWGVIARLEDDLEKASSAEPASEEWITATLRAVAPDRGDSLEAISDCVLKADRWLDRALGEAAARSDTVGDAAALEVKRLLQEWKALDNTGGEQ